MNKSQKCRAVGGPVSCKDPLCPEKMTLEVKYELSSQIMEGFAERSKNKIEIPTGWNNDDTELLKTIHGSKLYGLSHAESDDDYYIVVPSRYVGRKIRKQSIVDGIDSVVVDFKTFNKMAEEGAPQALEAMYSKASVSDYFEPYRNRYYSSSPDVVNRYLRTMKAFIMSEGDSTFKKRRHALRLAYNLEELIYTGRFNPTLPTHVAQKITGYAEKPFREYYKELSAFTPIQVDWNVKSKHDFEAKLRSED